MSWTILARRQRYPRLPIQPDASDRPRLGAIKYRNRQFYFVAFCAVLVLCMAFTSFGREHDISGKVAFISLTTAQLQQPGKPAVFAPHVLLRFVKKGSASGVLALTDQNGIEVIPIEAGEYCATAYGIDGRIAKLSTDSSQPQNRCFTAVAGKTMEFSLTLAADAKYGGRIPSLGVQ
jgi:hypothetical protein